MPTGNSTVWMMRVRDRGKVYKIDFLDLCRKAGMNEDAYGQPLPDALKKVEPVKEKEKKKTKKDEAETS